MFQCNNVVIYLVFSKNTLGVETEIVSIAQKTDRSFKDIRR